MWEADADNLFESSSTPAPFPGHTSQRVVSSGLQAEDLEQDRNLRPKTLDEYLGQERVKSNLRVLIEAAKSRNEPLDHVIFSVKQRLLVFWQEKWVQSFIQLLVLQLSEREI